VALSLYLDDCAYSKDLARMLRDAGHTVTVPAEAGLTGEDGELHFLYARQNGCITVTKNPSHFIDLHNKVRIHPGIFLIYQDNDVTKDMSYGEIVLAIQALERAYGSTGTTLANDHHNLNDWRVRDTQPPVAPDAGPANAPPPAAAKTPAKSRTKGGKRKSGGGS
jgi:hypothetical protein